MKKIFIPLIAIWFAAALQAQDCTCCHDVYNQFDFWVGEWDVFDTTGKKVGENNIRKVEGGCLLTERWEGMAGSTGRSQNFFTPEDSLWNQVWVDNSGYSLFMKGTGGNGKMVLTSELMKGGKSGQYKNEITWSLQDDGSVRQIWRVYSAKGEPLRILFDGIYRKKISK